MLYPRLVLARQLLSDEGVIFCSIDDKNQAYVKCLFDEIFGETNFAGIFPWRKRTAKSDVPFGISQDYEYILVFAKSEFFKASIEGGNRKDNENDFSFDSEAEKNGQIHIFEVKSVNKSAQLNINEAEYVKKVNALISCYLECSKKTNHIFYLPIMDKSQWQITVLKNGEKNTIGIGQFKKNLTQTE